MAADITRVAGIGMDGVAKSTPIGPLPAGDTFAIGDVVRLDSDGKVRKALSGQCTVANVSDYIGFIGEVIASGQSVTVYGKGTIFRAFGSSLTENAPYYIGATEGTLYDAQVASADDPVAIAINTTDVLVVK